MAGLITALATHRWISPGGTLVISTKLEQTEVVGAETVPLWPRFVLMQPIKGLRALPDMDDNREDNTEANGETPRKAYARGKTLTYAGRVYGDPADGWASCAEGADAFLAALGPDIDTGAKQTGFMTIIPTLAGLTDQSLFGGQCMAAEVVERFDEIDANEQPSPYWWDFTFDIRMSDGRFVGWDPVEEEVIADSFKW